MADVELAAMWDHLPIEALIEMKMAGQYGLLPRKWFAQLEQIRALPETKVP